MSSDGRARQSSLHKKRQINDLFSFAISGLTFERMKEDIQPGCDGHFLRTRSGVQQIDNTQSWLESPRCNSSFEFARRNV